MEHFDYKELGYIKSSIKLIGCYFLFMSVGSIVLYVVWNNGGLGKDAPLIIFSIYLIVNFLMGFLLFFQIPIEIFNNENNVKGKTVLIEEIKKENTIVEELNISELGGFNSKEYPDLTMEINLIKKNNKMDNNSILILISFCKNHTIPSNLVALNKDFTQKVVSNKIITKQIQGIFKKYIDNAKLTQDFEEFLKVNLL